MCDMMWRALQIPNWSRTVLLAQFLSAKQWGRERLFSITRPTRICHAGGSISSAASGTSSTGPGKPTTATRPSRGTEPTSGCSNTTSEPACAAGRQWNSRRTWGTYQVWLFMFWLVFPLRIFATINFAYGFDFAHLGLVYHVVHACMFLRCGWVFTGVEMFVKRG